MGSQIPRGNACTLKAPLLLFKQQSIDPFDIFSVQMHFLHRKFCWSEIEFVETFLKSQLFFF